MARRPADSVAITHGSTNVFEDLGYPDAAERQAKLRLAYALNQVLAQQGLTQTAAARLLGLTQPKVSALRHYKLAGAASRRGAPRRRPDVRSHAEPVGESFKIFSRSVR